MEITKIDSILTGSRRLFVKVHTDTGITGIGESGNWGFREAVVGAINRMEKPLIGQDPLRIEYINDELYKRFKFGGTVIGGAISAIDIALWDIKGKYYNAPIYQLLGGAVRKKIRLWGVVDGRDISSSIKSAKELKAKGYTCIRLNPTNIEEAKGTYARRMNAMSEMIHAIRDAIGLDVDLGCEIHRALQPHESITLLKMVEDCNLLFFEDPINYENYFSLKTVTEKTKTPISAGERGFCIQDIQMLLQNESVSFIRPDICLMRGITGCKKAAAIAESHYVNVIPHTATGSINLAGNLHLAAAIPNFEVLETCPITSEWDKIQKEIKTPFKIENGCIEVPEGPGLGIELRDDIEITAPYCDWEWDFIKCNIK
ncbi:mandelate racemase/muconate lactonizing enzyme family protein [Pectinatus frisingensis]|uniref:mandelate racemase/muconate lactonizing enzyme family protein n=1 Tax=Pectinatus frisingensis TaxID=865 RepID=UPI0015F64756|nr:mandelate racemase/muconate lactonizing enzyme family protein [Pectinatus frisingensis]